MVYHRLAGSAWNLFIELAASCIKDMVANLVRCMTSGCMFGPKKYVRSHDTEVFAASEVQSGQRINDVDSMIS